MVWFHDSYWIAALDAAKQLSNKHQYIVVPEEFVNERQEFFPVQQAKQLSIQQITAFVVQKDKISVLPISLLRDEIFCKFHCVFANEVFVIYSVVDTDPICDQNSQQHIPIFLEGRDRLLQEYAHTREHQDSLPYLLDTQQNRILKVMFPHKNYVTELFRGLEHEPHVLQQAVTKYCVKEVRIELSGFCNRSCHYCPVSFLGRKDTSKKLPEAVLKRCINDLRSIDFDGQIWFCLFNEPLYDKKYLFDALAYVSEALPKSFIKIVSNGDYLDAEYFQDLLKYRLNELTISVHYDGTWDLAQQKEKMYHILKRIGLEEIGDWEEGPGRLIFQVSPNAYLSEHLKMFSLRSEDFDIHGMDRGGTLESKVLRLENLDHCDVAISQLNISYDGTVVPCCNMCSDVPEIQPWSCGTVTEERSIFEIYTSQKAADFRKVLFAPRTDLAQTPPPCKTCSVAEYDGNAKVHRSDDAFRTEIYQSWLK